MQKPIAIHEGLTYEYLAAGVGILVVGGILSFISGFITVLLIVVGFLLMVVATGIEVDVENQKIRKYKSVLFLKVGQWQSLINIVNVELKYNPNSVVTKGPATPSFAVPFILPESGAAAKTFDLFLVDDTGTEKLINQFLKFSLALKTLKALEQIKHLKIINHYENTLKESRRERRF